MAEIALDLEGVCADTLGATIRESDNLTEAHRQEWGFPDGLLEEFLEISQTLWEDEQEKIPLLEPNVPFLVEKLRREHEVHLVTNRHGADEGILSWLDRQGITVDGFESNPNGTVKAELGYDIYIDDNPGMIGEDNGDHLYLIAHPYNDLEVDGDTTRVNGLAQVVDSLTNFSPLDVNGNK